MCGPELAEIQDLSTCSFFATTDSSENPKRGRPWNPILHETKAGRPAFPLVTRFLIVARDSWHILVSQTDFSSEPPMGLNRRAHTRLKTRVPLEIHVEGGNSPHRGATADLSLTGCYIETIFPWPIGTNLELKLQLDGTLVVLATVVTYDPQVGNGIQFNKMLPEDIDELRSFLEAAEKSE